MEKVKYLLFDADLPAKCWAEAVNTAVYLKNRSVASGLNNNTPFELWFGKKSNVGNGNVFCEGIDYSTRRMVQSAQAEMSLWRSQVKFRS